MPIVGLEAADEHVPVSAGEDVVVRQKDVRDYARILWRRKWYIVLAVVIAVGGMVARTPGSISANTRRLQESSPRLRLRDRSTRRSSPPRSASSRATQYEAIVAKHIDDPGTISANQAGVSGILEISATSTSPTLAARQANAWAAAYVAYRRSLAQNQALGSTAEIQRQIQSLQQQITSLNAQINFGGATNNAEATNVALRNALLGQQVSLQSQAPTGPTSSCGRHPGANRGDARHRAH